MAVALNGKRGIEFGQGTIEAANEKGIKVSGTWINYSKYPGGRPQDMPEGLDVGDRVQYKADGNFIKDLRCADDPFADDAPETAPQPKPQLEPTRNEIEQRITRLACLKAAAAAAKPGTSALELIAAAHLLATWANGGAA